MKKLFKVIVFLAIVGIIVAVVKHALLGESDCPEIDEDIEVEQ